MNPYDKHYGQSRPFQPAPRPDRSRTAQLFVCTLIVLAAIAAYYLCF